MNTEPEITATKATTASKIRSTLWTARSKKGKAGVILAGLLIVSVPLSALSGETVEPDVAIESTPTDPAPVTEAPTTAPPPELSGEDRAIADGMVALSSCLNRDALDHCQFHHGRRIRDSPARKPLSLRSQR